MRLTRIALSNLRNYSNLELEPQPGLNVFIGDNAQGKSNLLEAIALLGTGKSFRTNREADLIKHGISIASVSGEAQMRAGAVRLSCTIASTGRGIRKTYTLNGEPVRYARFLGSAKVVTFTPWDLQLVTGAPSLRRSMLNVALSQDQPIYYGHLIRYQKVLAQKAALLRGTIEPDAELLRVYNETLIQDGAALVAARAQFVESLNDPAHNAYHKWAGGMERLALSYEPNVPFEVRTQDAIESALRSRFTAVAQAEAQRKACIAGPHRDDVGFLLDGRSLAAFGSQGQHRMAVLALKVAEYIVMHERSAEAPLLFLDDVLSELDHRRAAAFLSGIGAYEQAFMTATSVPNDIPAAAQYRVANATLERIA
ncbi:MAG: DNA replication/repair protein RecF [Candidatus Eremiobacteraeota bacterium]|nr:DNA replication/repair protein RecF [Candidatus Eremiobacteraeota bacterium]